MSEWLKNNLMALVTVIVGQAIVFGIYIVNLEARVSILEDRGSPHLAEINTRLTTLEKLTDANKESLERIKDVMTRKLNINP